MSRFHSTASCSCPAWSSFPSSVGIAILRYRLLEVDVIVNRTLVWGDADGHSGRRFYRRHDGDAEAFRGYDRREKRRGAGDHYLDRRLGICSAQVPAAELLSTGASKQAPDQTRDLRGFGEQVRSFVQMSDTNQITQRLLEEAAHGLQAQSGALTLFENNRWRTVHTYGYWRGEAWVSIPLEYDGELFGLLTLGPRKRRAIYAPGMRGFTTGRDAGGAGRAPRPARTRANCQAFTVFENVRPAPVQNADDSSPGRRACPMGQAGQRAAKFIWAAAVRYR